MPSHPRLRLVIRAAADTSERPQRLEHHVEWPQGRSVNKKNESPSSVFSSNCLQPPAAEPWRV
eukprot:4242101-Prymnesium_polylepis.1